jgi:branched-chain amino acid transport system ATP-binding protein
LLTVCDRIVVIDFGRLIAEGTPRQIVEDAAVIKAYLGMPASAGKVAGTRDAARVSALGPR